MRFRLGGVEFSGESLDEELMVRVFEPGAINRHVGDKRRPQRHGMMAGKDFLTDATWAWGISARGNNLTEVLAADAKLSAAWTPPELLMPGVMVPLDYEIDGRWRRVYGRPGNYQGVTPDFIADSGIGHIDCEFRVMDTRFFSGDEHSARLTIVPATTGGLMAPLVAPLSTVRSSAPRVGIVLNAGVLETPLTVDFRGPVTNPYIKAAAGWEVRLNATLAYDEIVTVDAFNGTITRNGNPAPALLTRSSRLSSVVLPPGYSDITFGGTDLTGTATATLRWRDAHTSI